MKQLSQMTLEEVQKELQIRASEISKIETHIGACDARIDLLTKEYNYWKGIADYLENKKTLENEQKPTGKECEPCQSKP